MRFLHLADLHIGKTVKNYSMLEDQRHILALVTGIVRAEKPDAVVIAGDVYDRMVPGAAAVELFDAFLTGLVALSVPVLIIAGNHDSPERLAFAGRIISQSGVHIAGQYAGTVPAVTLEDAHGPVVFHLLPFVKPATVRHFLPDAEIADTHGAVAAVLAAAPVDETVRNVLVAHQFVTAAGMQPERSESEIDPVGGTDNVDANLFAAFDYVALGHLHGPQRIGRDTVRYAGSPLKYSFSEAAHHKAALLVELGPKGAVEWTPLPLAPLHDMRKIRGPLAALLAPETVAQADPEDYLQVTLTDEQEPPEALARLRATYPNVMELGFDNSRTRAVFDLARDAALDDKTPMELLSAFFEEQNGRPMNERQAAAAARLMDGLEVAP